ncbi:MAG: hypothetical protein M0Z76_09945 [Gammaproteobacteria bacterium]|nr:hypothetical protein [Gammaproteobacteria bacterium]
MTGNWRHMLCLLALLAGPAPAYAFVDPTCPPWFCGGAVAVRPPTVEAIWVRGGERLALINGHLVGRGSPYGRGYVAAIHRRSVILRFPSGAQVWPLLRAHGVRKSWVLSEEQQ